MPGCRAPTPPNRGGNGSALPEPHLAAARNRGTVNPADPTVGSAARLRHQPGHSRQFWRHPASGYRLAVSRAAPPGTPKMDYGGLEALSEQATRARVPLDRYREKAAPFGALALGATLRRHRRSAQSGQAGGPGMKYFWHRDRKQQE